MELGAEIDGVNAGALEIGGQGVEFAAGIRQMPLVQSGDDNAAAFNAQFQAVQFGGNAAQTVVSIVEAIEHPRVSRIVETMGAEEKMEAAQGMGSLCDAHLIAGGALAR